jgi:molecular chaperone DnaK (HSP70)
MLKAQEMLRAVDAAFAQAGGRIDPAEKEKIEGAASDVRNALALHDVRKLQNANNTLDESTQSLAATIVENAMRSAPG